MRPRHSCHAEPPRLARLANDSDRGRDRDRVRDRGRPVRLSLLSPELCSLVLVLGVSGWWIGSPQTGDSNGLAAKASLRGHENLIEMVAFAADGRTVISCGWDKQVRLWEVGQGGDAWDEQVASLPHSTHLFSTAITPNGKYLAVGGVGGFTIWEKKADSGWEKRLEHLGVTHRCVAAASDNRTLAVGGADGTIRLWDVVSLKEIRVLTGFTDEVRSVTFSRDDSLLVGLSFSGELRAWDLKSGVEPRRLTADFGVVLAFALSPDNHTLAVAQGGDRSTRLCIWDLATGQLQSRFSEYPAAINVLVFTPDGETLASGDKDRAIRLWNWKSGEVKQTLTEGLGWVKTIAFSPDGRLMAYGGQDGSVRFRDYPLGGKERLPGGS